MAMQQEWKVYFGNDFGQIAHKKYERAGKEFIINKDFSWNGNNWRILSVYCCKNGVVLDLCFRVTPEQTQVLMQARSQQKIEVPPCSLNMNFDLQINGKQPSMVEIKSAVWNPFCDSEVEQLRNMCSRAAIEHYQCDPAVVWCFYRIMGQWPEKKRQQQTTITLQMEQDVLKIPGPCFTVRDGNEVIPFVHPLTGQVHVLSVLEFGMERLPAYIRLRYHRPDWFRFIKYKIEPALEQESYRLEDCVFDDPPEQIKEDSSWVNLENGGQAITLFRDSEMQANQIYYQCSSIHFAPVAEVTWQLTFLQQPEETMEVTFCFT